MEQIAILDAKIRLTELLERTARGEAFEITEQGRPLGRLMPPTPVRNRQASANAVERLKSMSGFGGKMSKQESKSLLHEGHRH